MPRSVSIDMHSRIITKQLFAGGKKIIANNIIEELNENIEVYQIGMRSKGSVKLTPEDVVAKVTAARNVIDSYTAAEVAKIDQSLDVIV